MPAAPNLAIMLALGACGNWSLAEVRRLLQDAKAAAALCKPWLAKPGLEFLRSQLAEAQQLVDLADTLSPGQDRKPPITATAAGWEPMSRTAKLPQCSGCGQTSLQLRKCSGCKVAACELGGWTAGRAVVWQSYDTSTAKHCCSSSYQNLLARAPLQTARETARWASTKQ